MHAQQGAAARRDAFAGHHDDAGQVRWAESAGIDVVRGHGRLAGERLVRVASADGTARELRARHAVVIATESVAVVPDVLAPALPWTSRDVTNLHEVPERVLIGGGGCAGMSSRPGRRSEPLRGRGSRPPRIRARCRRWFVGPGTAELVNAATIAVVGRVPVETLWHAVPSSPTMSEVWLRLLEVRR